MKTSRILAILVLLSCLFGSVGMVAAADNITKNAPDNATVAYNAGVLLVSEGNYQSAIDTFNSALAMNTTVINKTGALDYVYQGKTFSQIQLGQYADAVATAEVGLARFSNDPKLWNNKGYALYKQGNLEDALTAYNQALSFDQNDTSALINKGDTLTGLGRYSDAIAAYNQALATDPGNQDATTGLALAQKGASSPLSSPVLIVLVIVVIIVAGGAVWYIKFRKPDEKKPGDKKADGKKK